VAIKATREISGHCGRCKRDVRTVRPWRHWRKIRYVYFAILGVAVFGTPVLLCDGFVLIPLLMLFIVAIGPLNTLVHAQPTCADCGAVVAVTRGKPLALTLLRSPADP
jgi:hypothetical protein